MFTKKQTTYINVGQGKNAGLFTLQNGNTTNEELHGTITSVELSFDEGDKSKNIRSSDLITLFFEDSEGAFSLDLPLRNATAAQFLCQCPDVNTQFLTFSLKKESIDGGDITSIFVKVRESENVKDKGRNCKRPYSFIKNKGVAEFYATKPAADKNTPRERIGEPIPVEQILNELCDLLNIPFTDAR